MNSASLLLILLWPFLLLLFLLPSHFVHPLPIQQLTAPLGRPFTFSTAEGHAVDAEMLPRWCRFNSTARLIYGIPQITDFGLHLISIHDTHIEVEVVEEEQDLCGSDSSTTWLEIMDARQLADLPVEEQFQTIKALLAILQKEVEVRLGDVRLFPRSYLARYRTVSETIHKVDNDNEEEEEGEGDDDDEEEKDARANGRIVFMLNISCGELTEQASDIINAVAENGLAFQVVEGVLRSDRMPITTSTTTTTTQQYTRTTRRVHNNRPIVLNPLKTFTCSRGLLCRLTIDENTFMDPEDGATSRLLLSVHPIGNHTNFLAIVPGTNLLEGVPMENGTTFSFRLEARDRQNSANSAPFQVLVKSMPEGKPNHRYSMLLDTPLERFQSRPEYLRDFVYKLNAAIRRVHSADWEGAREIQIEELVDNGTGQTMAKWWNGTLSWAHCDEARINATRDRMVHAGTERVRHEFVKQMGAQFHVRKVALELLGKCLTRYLLNAARIRVYTTTQRSTDSDRGERQSKLLWTNQLLIPLILLATILLLVTVLALLCCAHHKRGRKGAKRNEFATKGRPVVFPDEVPHRDESSSADGSLATVTTPMLVEREQPPLDPTKMTMHENPLYRPPPQVQAQLVRKQPGQHELSPPLMSGGGISPPARQYGQQPIMASTFSPPGAQLKPIDASPSPLRANPFLRDNPAQQSVRIHATPVGQRLPPPYVAH